MTYNTDPEKENEDNDELMEELLEESVLGAPDLGALEYSQEPEYTEILDNVHEQGGSVDNVIVETSEPLDVGSAKKVSFVDVREKSAPYGNDPVLSRETPRYAPPLKNDRKWQYIAIFSVLLLIIGGSFAVIYMSFGGDIYTTDEQVAVIYVQGFMLTGNLPSGFGYATSEDVCSSLRKATDDDRVKAIVLRVNSGGGSPVAAEEIVTEIKRVQDMGVPVVISMGDVAASAAYYISAPADLIVANPSTTTGSIGVISVYTNRSEFYDDEGIEFYVSKSGSFKDVGGDWRGLTSEEKEYVDNVVLDVYDLFITSVAENRNMTKSEVKDIADGRIYIGREAQKIGLVDELGNFYDAIDAAAELGGIEGEPSVYYINKPSLSSILFGSEETLSSQSVEHLASYYTESPVGYLIE
ncbi:signal peptide peptidase SppA [Methanococcoides sp. SA1]|nr:signal peptide peptidase SppA [Methanococcoides sp. SA1]